MGTKHCPECGDEMSTTDDSHNCDETLEERVEQLETMVDVLRDDNANMRRCLNGLSRLLAEFIPNE